MGWENTILETKYWKVKLASDQYYLGRCVVVLRREVQFLSDLTKEEFLDLFEVVKKLEDVSKKVLGATMFNWTCLTNSAYRKDSKETPWVHLHFRPRYKKEVEFEGMIFKDHEFGFHYKQGTDSRIPKEIMDKLVKKLKASRN